MSVLYTDILRCRLDCRGVFLEVCNYYGHQFNYYIIVLWSARNSCIGCSVDDLVSSLVTPLQSSTRLPEIEGTTMGTKLDMTSALESCAVSSVLNRDVKQFGKKHLFDEDLESCWSSEASSPQWIQLTLKEPKILIKLAIQFQGGFAGSECTLESDGNDVVKFYPNDDNSLQKIDLPPDFRAKTLKIVFSSSTDFFGRIIVYRLWLET